MTELRCWQAAQGLLLDTRQGRSRGSNQVVFIYSHAHGVDMSSRSSCRHRAILVLLQDTRLKVATCMFTSDRSSLSYNFQSGVRKFQMSFLQPVVANRMGLKWLFFRQTRGHQ